MLALAHIQSGTDYKGALQDFTAVGGKVAMVPRAASGIWWTRWFDFTDEDAREIVNQCVRSCVCRHATPPLYAHTHVHAFARAHARRADATRRHSLRRSERSIDRSNERTNQPTNQPINQPTNQPTKH